MGKGFAQWPQLVLQRGFAVTTSQNDVAIYWAAETRSWLLEEKQSGRRTRALASRGLAPWVTPHQMCFQFATPTGTFALSDSDSDLTSCLLRSISMRPLK